MIFKKYIEEELLQEWRNKLESDLTNHGEKWRFYDLLKTFFLFAEIIIELKKIVNGTNVSIGENFTLKINIMSKGKERKSDVHEDNERLNKY